MKLHLDFETRSELNLNDVGAYKYAMHPSTEILCMGVGFPDGTVTVYPRESLGPMVVTYQAADIAAAEIISAHNAQFEFAIYHFILHKRYCWPERLDPKLWSCTQARAAQVGLPLALDPLGRVLHIKTPKDMDGRRVMHQLCKPTGYDFLGDPIWDNDPAKFQRLYAYNRTDVLAEMEVDALLPELPPEERAVWELDVLANSRGVAVDLEMAAKATGIAGKLTETLNSRLRVITNGRLSKATQVQELKQWLKERGVAIPTVEKKNAAGEWTDSETLGSAVIPEILSHPDLPPVCREAITIRGQVGKSSTAKYANTNLTACADGRVRGVLQYHAAHTGRWSGRLIQPQNYPKGFKKAAAQAEAIELILSGDAAAFEKRYGARSMHALSDALRGSIVAGPGRVFVSADYNAIEARVLFWLAGEEGALAAYRRGESPYAEMAQTIYPNDRVPSDVKVAKKTHPAQYDLGKRTILGCGYQMGAQKFVENVYTETAKVGDPVIVPLELGQRAVKSYRAKYIHISHKEIGIWAQMESAAVNAVRNPGVIYPICGGRVLWGMSVDRRFLKCRLPSGRFLWYWQPVAKMIETPWGEPKLAVCYHGEDPKTHQWGLLKTYGGSLTENVTQATARDLLAHGMLNVEGAGFPVVLTVHDEIISEIPEGPGDQLTDFIDEMCDLPAWASGCPVAAEGWVGKRYRK